MKINFRTCYLYVLFFLSLFPAIFKLSIFGMSISLYRIIMCLVVGFFFFTFCKKGGLFNCIKQNKYLRFMLFWLCYGYLSLLWVKSYYWAFKKLFFLTIGIVGLLMVVWHCRKFAVISNLLKIFLFSVLVHNIIGWLEISYKIYLFKDNFEHYAELSRPVSMFGNTNDFATYLNIGIFLLVICFITERQKLVKISISVLIVSSAILLFLTSSRANVLGVLAGISFYAFYRIRLSKRTYNTCLILKVFLGIGCTLLLLYKFRNMIFYTVPDDSLGQRINLIKNGLLFLKNSLGLGVGVGNSNYMMQNYAVFDTHEIYAMHNWWAELLTSFGIIVCVCYIKFYISLALSFWEMLRVSHNSNIRRIALASLATMVSFCLGSISSSDNISAEWLWYFWALMIILATTLKGFEHDIKHCDTYLQ